MISRLKSRIFNRKAARFSFAQAGEDLVLQRIFLGAEKGFYVDVGAYHPYRFSNTYLFYLAGWRGINIEPRPGAKKLFDKFRPEDINLEIGVAEKSGVENYYLFKEDTLNQFTFDGAAPDDPDSLTVVKVQVEPLHKIFERHITENRSIDFITIDTEGNELQVVNSNDWTDFPVKVILVEDNKRNKTFAQVTGFLNSKGYKEVYRLPVNAVADSVFYMAK